MKDSFPKVRVQSPVIRTSEEERLWREVKKFAALIPSEIEPNQGRVQEIREEIAKGTYLTRDKTEEAAARLAIRFMKSE